MDIIYLIEIEISKHAKPVVYHRLFSNNVPKVIYQYRKFYRIQLTCEFICNFPRIDFPNIGIDDGYREPQKIAMCQSFRSIILFSNIKMNE